MIFYYVRHGEPIYDPDSLTEYGHRQARALAKRLALYGLDEIYASDSNRAIQTAQPTCELLKKEAVLLPWANERLAWNEFVVERDGKRTWLFQDRESVEKMSSRRMISMWDSFADDEYFDSTNVRSGLARINAEVDAFFLSLGFRHDREARRYELVKPNNKRVALFAHQGFGFVFLSSLLDIPYTVLSTSLDMGHSGVTVIYFDESDEHVYPRVLQLSNDSHLYKEEILKGYQGILDI